MSSDAIEQGSDLWKNLRLQKITSTDLAVILGISPWKTQFELWHEKHGRGKPFIDNPAVARGRAMEQPLREWYEDLKGESYAPAVIVPNGDPRMASLDGINASRTRVLEIKTCGRDVFLKAQNGVIPDYYMSQVQHSMALIPEAKEAEFVFEWKGDKCLVTVPRDDLYIKKVTAICLDWYARYLVGDEEPPLSEKDYLDLTDSFSFACVSAEARLVYRELKDLESQWKAIKQRLLDHTDGGNAKGHGVTITQSTRKGTVDTEKLAADLDIDLDSYRKPSSTSVTIRVNLKYTDGQEDEEKLT